jgi:hypothetical protein
LVRRLRTNLFHVPVLRLDRGHRGIAGEFVHSTGDATAKAAVGGRFLLALPTVWLLLDIFEAYRPNAPGVWALWAATLASAFLTFPYLLYVAIVAVVPDIDRLNTKLRLALLVIVLVMTTAGFVLGRNHFLFLTCENFKVGGHDIPANCRKDDEATD